ncbi:Putative ribonuclease H protein At1g65750 [Linum perenne]
MQTTVIPISTCEAIDRRIRNFVWGSTNESRKVLHTKYFRETDAGLELRKLGSQFALWSGFYKEWDSILLGARSAIRNDRDTLFWTARWVDSGSRLLDTVEDTDAARNLSESVADYTNSDEQWDVEKLTSVLSLDQVSLVVGMTPPRAESGEDQWVWGGETNGHFSIRSAYKLIYTQANSVAHDRWKLCWKWKGPNRIRHFLWLTIQEKLLTNSERVKRHMTSNADCEHCHHQAEIVIHVLRDCTFATEVWRLIREFDVTGADWQGDLTDWMGHRLRSMNNLLFAIVCWLLWRARKQTISVAWEPGLAEWITLNSDGSFNARAGRATAGVLARDADGRCIFAYTMNFGNCSIMRAKMRGAIEGLRRTWIAGT